MAHYDASLPNYIVKAVAEKHNVTADYVRKVYNEYFREVRAIMLEIDVYNDKNNGVEIPRLGSFFITKKRYEFRTRHKATMEPNHSDSREI